MDEFDHRSQTGFPLKEEFVKLMFNLKAASSRTLGLLALFAAAFASRSIAGPLYTFTAINDPLGTNLGSYPGGINNGGQIAGTYFPTTGFQGFVYQAGAFATLSVPGAFATSANAINDAGQTVGFYSLGNGYSLGFLDNSGTFTTVNDPLATGDNELTGINNAGQIVGYYFGPGGSGLVSGFLYHGGTFTTIDDPLGIDGTEIYGINNAGQIVGYYYDGSGNTHGFLYSGGIFTTIDNPGGDTVLTGINDAGQIIGAANGIGNFLYSGGTFTHLADPLAPGNTTALTGINDAGQIVGYYSDSSDFLYGFLATPAASTPEPSTLAMTFAALLGIAAYRARKWRL
jgi:probable HAF family extracellular repeat protein